VGWVKPHGILKSASEHQQLRCFSYFRTMNRKKAWKWFKIVALIYTVTGIGLYLLQDKILFHPKSLPADYKYQFDIPFREVNLPVTLEKNLSIVQFTVPDSVCKGVVLYFHGNRENINRYARFATNFTKNNYEVWMMDYPGFGKSTGKRSEKILYEDALLFFKLAINKCAGDSIIIYGKSIGTGIAAQLASVRACKRLILETPYYSLDALARQYFFIYPVNPMTNYALPTYSRFEFIDCPITIFHGTRDAVVPYNQGKRLSKLKSDVELVTIQKGKHNNLNDFPLFHQKLDSLLAL
jgi:alpha-beta hydrolase superfamily lysophospholipase